jgi:hypothetical protein
MKKRWVLFYDGACPLCFKSKSWLYKSLDGEIKLTVVDLNSDIAKVKNYDKSSVVLETANGTFKSYHAWLKLLSKTKYKWVTTMLLRPFFIVFYFLVSRNRKLISKII